MLMITMSFLPVRFGVLHHIRDRVRRFQRRNDSLRARAVLKRFQRLVVGRVGVFDASSVAQTGVLRPDGGVIESALTLCVS